MLNQEGANPDYIENIVAQSRVNFTRSFLDKLRQARQANIYLLRPEIADAVASSQLDNPYLGSIGITLVEASRPPVNARHNYSFGRETDVFTMGMKGGGMRGIGGAGLAHIGGGSDYAAAHTSSFDTYKFDDWIHKVVGYYPVNLMSASK